MLPLTSLLLSFLFGAQLFFLGQEPSSNSLNRSPDGSCVVQTACESGLEVRLTTVRIVKDDKVIWSRQCTGESHFFVSDQGAAVALVPEGDRVRLRFLDRHGQAVRDLEPMSFEGGRFSADGRSFFANSVDQGLMQFSAQGKAGVNFGPANMFDISEDGSVVALAYGDQLRAFADKKLVFESTLPSIYVRGLALARNGRSLAVIDNKTLLVYDVARRKELFRRTLLNPIAVATAPAGDLFACVQETRDVTSLVTLSVFDRDQHQLGDWSRRLAQDYETVYLVDFAGTSELRVHATDDVFRFQISRQGGLK